jgi:TolA-binding protein
MNRFEGLTQMELDALLKPHPAAGAAKDRNRSVRDDNENMAMERKSTLSLEDTVWLLQTQIRDLNRRVEQLEKRISLLESQSAPPETAAATAPETAPDTRDESDQKPGTGIPSRLETYGRRRRKR